MWQADSAERAKLEVAVAEMGAERRALQQALAKLKEEQASLQGEAQRKTATTEEIRRESAVGSTCWKGP